VPLTPNERDDRLSQLDEIHLLELLGITSEDLINRFQDFIEEKIDLFEDDLEGW
jgi:hypothetical protein